MATVGGNRQEKRKRIMSYFINATIELMEKEGIENLTIRKVAEQAKYNSATLYHYFSNLDELELFASVKCLDEYMQETLIHKAEGKDFQEWYLGQWRCFCRHSFQRPRIYNFLFFSPEGTQNLNEVFRRYYEIYPNEKEEKTEDYEGFLKEGDFFKRNEDLLRDVIRERNYEISEQEIKELNEMSVLIYRGMLVIEDNELYKNELLQCLEQEESDIEIVGSASNGAEGLALTEKLIRDNLTPDVIFTDVPDAGDGWIRDDRGIAEKRDILQNCGYKFLPGIPLCETCDGAWCCRFSGQTVESLRSA